MDANQLASMGVDVSSTAHRFWVLKLSRPYEDPKWAHLWGLELQGMDTPPCPVIGLSFSWLSVTSDLVARTLWLSEYPEFDLHKPGVGTFVVPSLLAVDLIHSLKDWRIRDED